jgi:Uma2 family endonuclease
MSATATLPTPAASSRLMSADEFAEFVEREENQSRQFELVRGEVIEMSRPTLLHGTVVMAIGIRLGLYAESIGKGNVVTESGMLLEQEPDTVRGSDVAFFDDVKRIEDVEDGWSTIPPLVAVEVRSPGESTRNLLSKIDEYLDFGVKLVWLVDYEEKFITVYRKDRKHETFDEGDTLTCDELPGFTCAVANFFRTPGQIPKS